MVAITVILAAVIGAFVLEIGDQQETAPSTSFDSEQRDAHYKTRFYQSSCDDPNGRKCINQTELAISHAGGEVLDASQTEINVAGNTSVWGVVSPPDNPTAGCCPGAQKNRLEVGPVPDFRPGLGANEPVEFASGESWSVFVHGAEPAPPWNPGGNNLVADEYVTNTYYDMWEFDSDPHTARIVGADGPGGYGYFLSQEDQARVVWTAESGGKTQTLFKYSVQ
jgi:hypothetical protein